ncbi:MAG: folate family ECF transporter S component, partial [Anaerovorax sp.]
MSSKLKTTKITVIAFLMALEIILTRFLSLFMPFLRLGLGFLPVAITGILYGPLWAGASYAIGDILGMLIYPTGPYFPGFTLTTFLTGVTYGLILHKKQITWKRVIFAASIVCIV